MSSSPAPAPPAAGTSVRPLAQQGLDAGRPLARWPALLAVPNAPSAGEEDPGDPGLALVSEARAAVQAEQRVAGRARRLDVLAVTEEAESPGIYRLDVGDVTEADASWEGARAFKPVDLDETEGQLGAGELSGDAVTHLSAMRWSGEVVAVDETAGSLWIAVEPGADAPTTGGFLTMPFDFLRGLDQCLGHTDRGWRQALARGLHAALVGPDPQAAPQERWLDGPWSALWGPPGTGKTWTLGRDVARLVGRGERVLVVSTTNRATDGAALEIGRALRELESGAAASRRARRALDDGQVRRVGWGADIHRYESDGLVALLDPKGIDARRELARVVRARARARDASERARWGLALGELRANVTQELRRAFGQRGPRVVVATSFAAVRALSDPELRGWLEVNGGSFDRVLVDEAGLVSRATAACLSLWARRGVALVGDPRQLAPIARQSRVLAPGRARWVAESGLAFLGDAPPPPGVLQLTAQHRMHPEIRAAVSAYQYDDKLTDAPGVAEREEPLRDAALADQPRALWLVLDACERDPIRRRATRGPAHRSWERHASLQVLRTLVSHLPQAAAGTGLVISPFRAQAKAASELLDRAGLDHWRASTVHAQQGAEAETVVFDTVRAASTAWPLHEWRRLVNVALSRGRGQVFVVATRDEMAQPWLAPLAPLLSPRAVKAGSQGLTLSPVGGLALDDLGSATSPGLHGAPDADPTTLGGQLATRARMRPLTSAAQERLCQLRLDGGPRLVRGVAGSGKTWILASWVARTLADPKLAHLDRVWVVFGNYGLKPLLLAHIYTAWRQLHPDTPLPAHRLALLHVHGLLGTLLREQGQDAEGFDYGGHARRWLAAQGAQRPEPRCDALFIDEAQDMGPDVLRVLFSLVRPWDLDAPGRRAVHVFYDNDQNVFGRATPVWKDLGLDVRGRAAVLDTSFRSTRPIVEFARNLRYQLAPPRDDADHQELVKRGLVTVSQRLGRRWWEARFAEVDGPAPTVRTFASRDEELAWLAENLRRWLGPQRVRPEDVVVLVNGAEARQRVVATLQRAVRDLPGVAVAEQRSRSVAREAGVLRVSTAHSFKGHEAEVAVVACADTFVAGRSSGGEPEVLVAPLYVALTRARSMLVVSGLTQPRSHAATKVIRSITSCAQQQRRAPNVQRELPRLRLLELLAERLGDPALLPWLRDLEERLTLSVEPVWRDDGRLLCAPVLQLRQGRSRWVVFRGAGPSREVRAALDTLGVGLLTPGQQPGDQLGLAI